MIVYSILVCYNIFNISRLGCEFSVTVFLYYILIHQSQADSSVSSYLLSITWLVFTKIGFDWAWSKKITPRCACNVCFTGRIHFASTLHCAVKHTSHGTSGRNLFGSYSIKTDVCIHNPHKWRTLWLRIHDQDDLWSMNYNTSE